MLKLSRVFIRVVGLFQRAAKVTSSITPLRSEQCKESDNDAASIITRTLLLILLTLISERESVCESVAMLTINRLVIKM